jgi:hypothetical protein
LKTLAKIYLKHTFLRFANLLAAEITLQDAGRSDWGDFGMNVSGRKIRLLLFNVVVIAGVVSAPAFAVSQTYTGIVGDAMCGAKHVMPGDAAACTRGCISKGSKYALLIGDKVYVLDTMDKALLATLDKWSGEKVTVSGTAKDNTITVTSVKTAQ